MPLRSKLKVLLWKKILDPLDLAALDSISLGLKSCMGDVTESSLILKDLPALKTLTSKGYSFMNQQHIVLMSG